MEIINNKVVSVSYKLTVDEHGVDVLVEETQPAKPFVFLFGGGGLLEEFERNLKGLKEGATFDFRIDAKNGYGTSSDDNIINVPLEAFLGEDGQLDAEMVRKGAILPMVDNEGNQLQGMVDEVTDAHVRMNFNHPLADKELHFVGKVLNIRDASREEVEHGHVHGEGGHHH